MNQRILDRQTVNAMIPLVQHIADDLDRAYRVAAEFLEALSGVPASPEVTESLDHVQACVDEVEKLGGTVRSYAPVRVDFIAEVDGEIGYVCWETGDSEAAHFHAAMDACGQPVLSA